MSDFTTEPDIDADLIPIHEGRPTVVDLQTRPGLAPTASDEERVQIKPVPEGTTAEELEMQRQAYEQAQLELERRETSGDYIPAGTQGGGPAPAAEEEDLPQIDFNDLSTEEKFDALQQAVAFLLADKERKDVAILRLQESVQVLGQSWLRILHEAGEVDLADSQIVLPPGARTPGKGRMDVPK